MKLNAAVNFPKDLCRFENIKFIYCEIKYQHMDHKILHFHLI